MSRSKTGGGAQWMRAAIFFGIGVTWTWTVNASEASTGQAEEETYELEDLPVAAQGADGQARVRAGVGFTQEWEGAALSARMAGSLGDALGGEPGVTESFFSPASSRPIVRGLEGYRVGIFENGLGMGDVSETSPDHAVAVEPVFLRRLTLYKGAPALRFGGGAVGGAVDVDSGNVPSVDDADETRVILQGETGNRGRLTALEHTDTLAGHRLRLQAHWRAAEDYRIPGQARTEAYDAANRIRVPPGAPGPAPNPEGFVPNSDLRTRSAGLGWVRPGERWTVGAAVQTYEAEYGVPQDGHSHGNPFSAPGINAPSPADDARIKLNNLRILATARHVPLGEGLPLDARMRYSRFRQNEREGRFLTNAFAREEVEARIEGLHVLSGGTVLSGGVQGAHLAHQNRNTSYFLGRPFEDTLTTRDRTGALFLLGEQFVGNRFQLEGGFRTDLREAERRDPPEGFPAEVRVRRFVVPSIALGARIEGGKGWDFGLHFAETRRAPASEELFIEAPHEATGIFRIPDPYLRRERMRSVEGVVTYAGSRFFFQANAFLRDFDGFIFLRNEGYEIEGLVAYSHVQREARFRGVEGALRVPLWQMDERAWTLELKADWLEGNDRRRNEPLPRMPPARVSARLEGRWGAHEAFLECRYHFAQTRVPDAVFGTLAYEAPTSAYTLVHAGLQVSLLADRLSLRIRAENLLNREARHHPSFLKDIAPLPRRHFRFGLEYRF